MAKKSAKLAAVPEPEQATEDEGTYGVENREPGELHEAFSAWVQEELGEKVSPRAVQLAWTLRNSFRASEAYNPFRTAREQRKADRAAAAEAGEDEEKPKRGRKAAAKATSNEPAGEATPAAATGGRRTRATKASKAAAGTKAPF